MNDIERVVARIEADEANSGKLSCGETIAAAFLFNRLDWLPASYKHPLDAIDRLGEDWLHMVLECYRERRDGHAEPYGKWYSMR